MLFRSTKDMRRLGGIFYREQASPDRSRDSWPEKPLGVPRGDYSSESYDGMPSWVVPMTGAPYVTETSPDRAPSYGLVLSPTMNNPGSAKVIPSGHDFVNKQACTRVASRHLHKIALKAQDLIRQTSSEVYKSSRGVEVLYSMKKSDGKTFAMQASSGGKTYKLSITLDPLQITCSCPYWQWQGPEYYASKKGYLYGSPRGSASTPTIKIGRAHV